MLKRARGCIVFSEISILIISLFAFSFLVGWSIPSVSADMWYWVENGEVKSQEGFPSNLGPGTVAYREWGDAVAAAGNPHLGTPSAKTLTPSNGAGVGSKAATLAGVATEFKTDTYIIDGKKLFQVKGVKEEGIHILQSVGGATSGTVEKAFIAIKGKAATKINFPSWASERLSEKSITEVYQAGKSGEMIAIKNGAQIPIEASEITEVTKMTGERLGTIRAGSVGPSAPGSTASEYLLGGSSYGGFADSLISGGQWIGPMLGMRKETTDAFSAGLAAG